MLFPKKGRRRRGGSTGPGEGGSCVSPLSDSGVIGGSPASPELIRAIINKLNMKELVVSGGRGWARRDCWEWGGAQPGSPRKTLWLALIPESRCEKKQSYLISSSQVTEIGDRGVNITHT